MAVALNKWPSEVAARPAWEVRLLDEYLQKQPPAGDRVEIVVARLCTLFFNVHRDKSQALKTVRDYLPFYDPWPMIGRYTELDIEYMRALGR